MSEPARNLIPFPRSATTTDFSPSMEGAQVLRLTTAPVVLDIGMDSIKQLLEGNRHTSDFERISSWTTLMQRYATSHSSGREGTAMADEDWLRSLIEKMDQDRRELDARVQHSIDKIERLIERQTDAMEKTRQEISAQNNVINSRIDQAYAHFQSTANDTKWAVVASVVAIVALVVTVILK